MVLILLALFGRLFRNDRAVYGWTIGLTLVGAVYDLFAALPKNVFEALHGPAIKEFVCRILPFAKLGLGWVCPALLGLVIGLAFHFARRSRALA